MKEAVGGNGHAVTLHAEFETSPRSATNLLQQFRYRLQNNRTVQRAKDSVGRAAHYVHDHSPKDMAAGLERLVRRRPGAALAVAVVAGFLIGRSIRRR
jgi:ElaB/YqjD/DUF883 family membrane-anchored ribosome-binding protein